MDNLLLAIGRSGSTWVLSNILRRCPTSTPFTGEGAASAAAGAMAERGDCVEGLAALRARIRAAEGGVGRTDSISASSIPPGLEVLQGCVRSAVVRWSGINIGFMVRLVALELVQGICQQGRGYNR